jgi:geranylgeranyl pyrophosphate synthase
VNLCDLLERHLAAHGLPRRLWERALLGPAREFLRRPAKGLRGRLLEASFDLAGGGALPADLPGALELLHAGSLVLDDIEDASAERRGGPALHHLCGTGVALNTGNWMVFCAVQIIGQAGFPAQAAVEAQRRTASTLVACHQGQALDLALPVAELDRHDVAAVVAASTGLRTASLTELAAALGALAAGADAESVSALAAIGREVGVGLQQLDDLGGLASPARRQKGLEDLRLGRPTWPWAWAAERESEDRFARLQAQAGAVLAGADPEPLRAELIAAVEPTGRERARATLRRAWNRAVEGFPASPARARLAADIDRLEKSYG